MKWEVSKWKGWSERKGCESQNEWEKAIEISLKVHRKTVFFVNCSVQSGARKYFNSIENFIYTFGTHNAMRTEAQPCVALKKTKKLDASKSLKLSFDGHFFSNSELIGVEMPIAPAENGPFHNQSTRVNIWLAFLFFPRFSDCKQGSGPRGTMSCRMQRIFCPTIRPSIRPFIRPSVHPLIVSAGRGCLARWPWPEGSGLKALACMLWLQALGLRPGLGALASRRQPGSPGLTLESL